MKSFLPTMSLCLLLSAVSAQTVIEVPVTKSLDHIKWETAKREYFSTIWQTETITNVAKPIVEVFQADKTKANGTAVVICPGGGLYAHSIESEGRLVAKWLNKIGVSAFVLQYRLVPTGEDGTKDIMNEGAMVEKRAREILPLATSDALNTIKYIREHAAVYNIDPSKIGLIGFSAGGAVTMNATYNYQESNKPNFIGPVYAWMNVVDQHPVPTDAPPMFAVCASDDPLMLAPASVQLYSDWLKKGKVAELHMYSKGGHGFGMKVQNMPSDQWIERFGEWMNTQGYLK